MTFLDKDSKGNRKKNKFISFFIPSFSITFFIRLFALIIITYCICKYICVPAFLNGESMAPTYNSGSFNFCWRASYIYSSPKRGDVVMIRFSGTKVMLLKRVVALAGEIVEFRKGVLFIDGKPLDEPYVFYACDWDLEPRVVDKGNFYVIGDNRSMDINIHKFGQVNSFRIMGNPLW